MKVICDNCRAVYKIPDEKLLKPVNKATCRKCGHRMLIPRPRQGASPDEKTLVTAVPPTPPPAPQREMVHDRPTTPMEDEPENTMPGVGATPMPSPGRRVAGPIDDVPLFAATPMPAAARDQVQMKVRMTPAPPPTRQTPAPPPRREPVRSVPPAPDLSYGGNTPRPPRARTPEPPPPSRSAPRHATPQHEPRRATPQHHEPRHATPQHQEPRYAPPPEPRHAPPQHDARSISPAQDYREPRQATPVPSRRTPAPLPASAPPPHHAASSYPTAPSQAGHDPAGDLVLALLGTAGAMLGALILVVAFATTATALPLSTLILIGFGMLLAFGGGMSTLLVIVTGGRGRRPARPLVSVVLGTMMGSFVTVSAVGLFVAKDQWLVGGVALPIAMGTPTTPEDDGSVLAAATPVDPPVEGVAAAIPDPTTAAGAVAAADVEPATEPPPKTTTSPKTTTTKSSEPKAETFAPRTTTTTTTKSTPPKSTSSDLDDILAEDPPPKASTTKTSTTSAPPASNLPESVPDDVIDTILRNNLDLKKCFFNHKKATGTLPSRVTVGFTLEPSGQIKNAAVSDAEYAATELDSCLSKALVAIQMPPSSGAARKVKYPFQLQ